MKTFIRKTLSLAFIVIVVATSSLAQRVVTGTVYRGGELAAGVTVEAHKGSTMMTSFDGKYEVTVDAKSKWLKFTFIDDSERLPIEGNTSNEIDFAFDGNIPSSNGKNEGGDINLQTAEELIRSQNTEFRDELSLYNEFFKQEDYESALPHWKKVYNKFPKSTLNIYIHGVKMYQSFIDNANTKEEKEQFFNELMNIFDKRMKYFSQRGFVQGRKGTAYLKYQLDATNNLESEELKEVGKSSYEWLSESVKEMGNETETPVLVLFMQTSGQLFRMGELPKETVVVNYEKCNSIINSVIAENADAEKVEKIKKIQPVIERIFGASGAADCEALVNIFTPQFQEKGDDIDFVKSMLRRLRRAKCDEMELFAQATERLYELEPSAEAAFNMAHRYLKQDDAEKAKEYYIQAMEQETDQELLSSYYYEYAYFIYAKENALSEARSFARKALDINPNYCQALILIGDIYVAGSRSFSDDDFVKATVFWVAVDYFDRARSGEECAIDAAQKVSTYKKYFPNKEEGFFRGITEEGKNYKVEGWINETTKIRF
ncbi:MAG: hypothetical protein HN778_06610 [Prolixibacteraceae bacterium]|jgi:tetratricopeptide (TPR) repeat protein|nr:hypothetical protein [Prolixibacteraceae bacterium]MBT6999013.1 hypothetical protein [Prolixibacteraceae bacterium]MBT7394488.1 hypothetical protein [Prolixibacteraceae bacterium]